MSDEAKSGAAAWPHGAPEVGQRAERRRLVEAADIERFTEISGDPPSLRPLPPPSPATTAWSPWKAPRCATP